MSRMGAYVQELQERDSGEFDEHAWLNEVIQQEQKKVSLPPSRADNGSGFAPSQSEPDMN